LQKISYDPQINFAPICNLATVQEVIVVNSASPYHTFGDLVSAARERPGDLTVASPPATITHIAYEMLKRATNVNMSFAPTTPGLAPPIKAVLEGRATAAFANLQNVEEELKAGKLRALASASRTRVEALPDVPTVAESGYKDFELDIWDGVFAPPDTAKETLSQLSSWFTAALRAPEIARSLVSRGYIPSGLCGADFAAFIHEQSDEYGRVIRETNIKAQ
jgi:tripartite-type tricarboxylate transporter receptor subunit TctC